MPINKIVPQPDKGGNKHMTIGQEYAETPLIEAGGDDPNVIFVPKMGGKSMISSISANLVILGTASGKVQVTNDPIEKVEAETNSWADWDVNGIGEDPNVAVSTMVEFTTSITALRVVAATASDPANSLQLKTRFNLQS